MAFASSTMATTRTEYDSIGPIEIPTQCYYGAETARLIKKFRIGLPSDQMPIPIIKAFCFFKKVCAIVNMRFGVEGYISNAIQRACDDVINETLINQFPLTIWETSSGKQTNVNVNEVIANRAIEILKGVKGTKTPVHPVVHVDKNQDPNRTFVIAMHVAVMFELNRGLYPALEYLQKVLEKKSDDFSSLSSFGRTNFPDAVPKTLDQAFAGYIQQIDMNMEGLKTYQSRLSQLPIDDTAVETGINPPESFGNLVAWHLTSLTPFPFINVSNKFQEFNTYSIMVELSGALNALTVCLMDIVNDIRQLGTRPRGGISELILSENEPNSSIMSDQVDLTSYEAMTMVAAQVMSNHVALPISISTGHFKLNVLKPLIIKNILHSIHILRDVCYSFADHLKVGIKLNTHASATYEQQNNLSAAPHFYEAGELEKFTTDSSSAAANEKVFGNVGGTRLTTATAQMDYNKYDMKSHELINRKNFNSACQTDDPSARCLQKRKRRSLSASPEQGNYLSSTSKIPNSTSSPLINLMQMVNNLQPTANIQPAPQQQQQQQHLTVEQEIKRLADELKHYLPPHG